jgi:hypothetical protein
VIVDTGSGVAAFPCKELCEPHGCGKHLNPAFEVSKSTSHYFHTCGGEDHCQCADNNRCRFYQRYAEGSYYDGYVVTDQFHFGETGHEEFKYTFGCVKKETSYFYSQKVDGILGLSPKENQRSR